MWESRQAKIEISRARWAAVQSPGRPRRRDVRSRMVTAVFHRELIAREWFRRFRAPQYCHS